ncbi:hypothetical protein [Prochlorococcus marinus]|uniref:hypothetical protein n=1 Tax=Prochlorococcus marinus TaxID=1219 RepID=UPI001ADBD6CE|nr:hypothetical protein [Prochlorococcus marinus]MBO8219357.1 hypothetical protein [Prochlorococcus marinus CUG1416]MBW3051738.1 hypothetical protein [Prochlorococcus marinus str. MU1416]
MKEKYKILFAVKSSLISLYIALTVPIPFISSEQLKIPSLFFFILGLFLIININSDYVETCEQKISYKTSFISRAFGKNNWEILWKEIKSIKPLQTSQGSKVFYFVDAKGRTFLVPQRIENFGIFLDKIESKTNISTEVISYISPLWTYKLLTMLSFLMIVGEIILFLV